MANQAYKRAEKLNQMSKSTIPFSAIATLAEETGNISGLTQGIGRISNIASPILALTSNNISYNNGQINKNMYYYKNTGIITSSAVGYVLGIESAGLGFVGGIYTQSLFDIGEKFYYESKQQLNNFENQLKSYWINSVSK